MRMAECHPDRKHFGKGLCRTCYMREERRAAGIPPREPARTPDCHPTAKHRAHGLCQPCYAREWERNRGRRRIERTPAYVSWHGMKQRCRDSRHSSYHYYGGRGITVCDRWLEPRGQGFLNFLADLGERPEGTSIDRIDVDGNYEPGNVRWATPSEQNHNRRLGQLVAA